MPRQLSQAVPGSCCRTRMPSLKEGQVLKQTHFCYLTGTGQLVGGCLLGVLIGEGERRKHQHLDKKEHSGTRPREHCSLKNLDKIGNGDRSKGSFQEDNYEANAAGVLGNRIDGGMAEDNLKFRVYETEVEGSRVQSNWQSGKFEELLGRLWNADC